MKNKKLLIQILSVLLLLALLIPSLIACKSTKEDETVTKLSFKSAASYDYLKSLDGTTVSIRGYMATSSPVDGSFIFLMNLPYQSCPFCVPNTNQLSNTMEIYPKQGERFEMTNQAIEVVGTLVVAESPDKPFTDLYGYEFNFKIVDADYTILKAEDLSEDMALWQRIANTDVVTDLYKMYDYVNFVCAWNTYIVNETTDKNGNKIPGYYLAPGDAERFLYKDGAQYNYGTKDGYFDEIVKKIMSADPEAFSDLIDNVRKAEALSKKALDELKNKNYTSEKQYIEKFDTTDYIYTLNKGEELTKEKDLLFQEFSNWLGSWEM